MSEFRSLLTFGFALAVSFFLFLPQSASAQDCVTAKGRYKVRIDSAPQGARIYLSKKECGLIGHTPWEGKLPKGSHTIVLEADGYKTASKMIKVRRTRRLQESFVSLEQKDEARLDIRGDADPNVVGAEVFVDGKLMGNVPVILTVSSGRHLIEVKKAGFKTLSQWLETRIGERLTVTPVLQRDALGSILVNSDEVGAEVWVNGRKHPDNAPTMIANLPAGAHVIEVKKTGKPTWKQTVVVEPNKITKVTAQFGAASGSIKVLTNVDDAKVYLDGREMGQAPLEIKDISVGDHILELRKEGYQSIQKTFTISAGSSDTMVLNMTPVGGSKVVVTIVSSLPESEVIVDGERLGNAPQELALPPGQHTVLVSKEGYKTFEKQLDITEGSGPISVRAEMDASGELRVVSTPPGATVLVDGKEVGVTPIEGQFFRVGTHVVSVQKPEYQDYETQITIVADKAVIVNARLAEDKTSEQEMAMERARMTSLSATALDRGRAVVNLGAGYPYYGFAEIAVGAGKIGSFKFDAGALIRTNIIRSELGVKGRMMLVHAEPFSAAVFAKLGGGASFFDDSARNSFFLDAGARASLTALGKVTVTGGVYLNFWTDRHCPAYDQANMRFDGDPIDTCAEYQDGTLDPARRIEIDDILDGDNLLTRDNGIRLMVEIAVEVTLSEHWTAFGRLEGAPFQSQRMAYRNDVNGLMFTNDLQTYFEGGLAFKF